MTRQTLTLVTGSTPKAGRISARVEPRARACRRAALRPIAYQAVFISSLLVLVMEDATPLFAATSGSFQQDVFVSGLSQPTAMAFAPDGRLFVSQKAGRLRVIQDGALLTQPFVTISGIRSDGERGLLGVAFDPLFTTNGYVYVYYSYDTGVDGNRVSRFTVDPANPNVALPGSELVVLNGLPQGGNHDGGAIHFGPDGYLYIAVGDVGTSSNAQSLSTPAGKILRISPATYPDIIPPDNPFVGVPGARGEIWALGLRNPFTFAFDPTDGTMYINDVGQNTWEEINLGAAGANYGWPICEGPRTSGAGNYEDPTLTYPLHAYRHPEGYAVTGGTFYYGDQFPTEYSGSYFFADYVGNWIRRLPQGSTVASDFADNTETPVDLRVGPDGSLYVLSISDGAVYRIRYLSANAAPIAVVSATPTAGPPPLTVTFDGTSSVDPDGDSLTYLWDFGDGAPSEAGPFVAHTYASAGRYTARLAVDDGSDGRDSVAAVITVGNPPFGSINLPSSGTRYSAGDTVAFSGTASDPEDGALSAARFSWTIVFHHDTHTHPFLGPIQGVTAGSVTIPTVGETAANVFYRVHLTVTDSTGLTHESTRDILPRTATIQLGTEPVGLAVTLDGQPVSTPYSVLGVAGMRRTVGAVSPQTVSGQSYEFVGWSDGGAQTHPITTPSTATAYVATFRNIVLSSQPKETSYCSAPPMVFPTMS
jgi:glucose/arabinose dehydrogenase